MSLELLNSELERLAEVYSSQISSFDEMLMPDLQEQSEQRDKLLKQIKNLMKTDFHTEDQEPQDALVKIKEMADRIEGLLQQNMTLVSKVKGVREELSQSMSRLTRGRRAISAYGSPQSLRNRSKVINVRK